MPSGYTRGGLFRGYHRRIFTVSNKISVLPEKIGIE